MVVKTVFTNFVMIGRGIPLDIFRFTVQGRNRGRELRAVRTRRVVCQSNEKTF